MMGPLLGHFATDGTDDPGGSRTRDLRIKSPVDDPNVYRHTGALGNDPNRPSPEANPKRAADQGARGHLRATFRNWRPRTLQTGEASPVLPDCPAKRTTTIAEIGRPSVARRAFLTTEQPTAAAGR